MAISSRSIAPLAITSGWRRTALRSRNSELGFVLPAPELSRLSLSDSPLEGDGFELPVPREIGSISTFGEE
jgi:hypothetical protein